MRPSNNLLIILLLAFSVGTMAIEVPRSHQPRTETQNAVKTPRTIESEEYAVYSAVINNRLRERNAEARRNESSDRMLVIKASTAAWVGGLGGKYSNKFYDNLRESSPAIKAETLTDLKAKNMSAHKLERRFTIEMNYVLVSDEEIDDHFKSGVGGGWEAYYQKYPKSGGFLTFSRVGLNADKTQALVYQGHACDGLCGGGGYLLLAKKNGAWVVERSAGPSWVS